MNFLFLQVEPGVLNKIWSWLVTAWDYEITIVQDKPVLVSNLIIGLLVLTLGIWLARRLARLLRNRVLAPLKIPMGTQTAYQSLTFYVLLAFVVIFALHIANIPITAFSVIGGALAIGVGLGSQNLVRDFISGITLLIERPIRVGDMVEVDGLLGEVERIGARSTRIRTFVNTHIIVPNTSFLEHHVVNWTLSDEKVRVQVNVGVAYGSNTRDVIKLINRAVDEHGRILKTPKPVVLFTDFGDNALQFETHFWIKMKSVMDRETIRSDIRHRIDHFFRDAGIVIAFPQRDVHFETATPVEVRVLRDDPELVNK